MHENIFPKATKIARARAYFFQIVPEKSCDYVLIIYMKKYEIAYHCMQKQSARIECENIYSNLQVTLCVQSKQPRTIKTIIYNDIFTSLRRKKDQSPAK